MIIRELDIFTEERIVQEIVAIYQEAFAEPPWNEGFECPVCNSRFPLSALGQLCSRCFKKKKHKIPLARVWTEARVIHDFYGEMRRPGARCFIAEALQGDFSNTLGFAWGYQMTLEEFRHEHRIPTGCVLPAQFFYLDEIAVHPNQQGRGIGKQLAEKIFGEQPEKTIVLRTHKDSKMRHLVEAMGGRIICKLPRSRIIMLLEKS